MHRFDGKDDNKECQGVIILSCDLFKEGIDMLGIWYNNYKIVLISCKVDYLDITHVVKSLNYKKRIIRL
ncbi:hypothetical protein [Zhenhengia sp.]|uniref:hypothetical protein n=1 Tax=Zhenhengia sp. TaxID=2944208 RepID=UPI003079D296